MCRSKSRAGILSILGAVLVMILLYLRNPPDEILSWFVSTLSDTLQVSLVLVPAFVIFGCVILGRVVRLIQPKPGNQPIRSDVVVGLVKAFEADRNQITNSTIPRHEAQAGPARNSRSINLGDAAYVLSKEDMRLLKDFIGEPKGGSSSKGKQSQSFEKNVLIITGEPGSGKSVLVQEIHASLSEGVEKEYHTLLPVFVFARDIRLQDLKGALNDDRPMVRFLMSHYSERGQTGDLGTAYGEMRNQLDGGWDDLDFLVIIDGLDEIPQRSQYEQIQRQLQRIIEKDIKGTISRKAIHRYILSCRVDEDIKVFQSATVLRLRGLTDRQIERYCDAQVDHISSKHDRSLLLNMLQSAQLVPSHVFRRNPYFLALLTSYLNDTRDTVREELLNFEELMEKYLDRETRRSYVTGQTKSSRIPISLNAVGQLKRTAWPFLHSSAFQFVKSTEAESLYRETPLEASIIKAFLEDVFADTRSGKEDSSQSVGDWHRLRRFLETCANSQQFGVDVLPLTPFDGDYHNVEQVIRVASRGLRRGSLSVDIALKAVSDLIQDERLEYRGWYEQLALGYVSLVRALNLDEVQTLACVFLFRSIVAAQLLRVIYLSQRDGEITFRFRHRRLAEYYAACYCRDRWNIARQVLQPSPWLGPVLNLVCALQRSQNFALEWLVDQIVDEPTEPQYEWRYSVEIACEAISFAGGGSGFDLSYNKLVAKVLHPLLSESTISDSAVISSNPTTRSGRSGFAVTNITLHRKLIQLSALATALKKTFAVNAEKVDAFYRQTTEVRPEWLPYHSSSCAAVESMTGTDYPWRYKLRALRRFIMYPASLLFPSERNNDSLRALRRIVLGTTIFGETICWITWFGMLLAIWLLVDALSSPDAIFLRESWAIVAVLLVFLWVLWRPLAFMRTPTYAVTLSSAPWRLPPWLFAVLIGAAAAYFLIDFVVTITSGLTIQVFSVSWSFSEFLAVFAVPLVLLIALFIWFIREVLKNGILHVVRLMLKGIAVGLAFIVPSILCIGLILLVEPYVPSQPSAKDEPHPTVVTEKALARMERLVNSKIPEEPEDDFLGVVEGMLIERNANRRISQIDTARETLRATLTNSEAPDRTRMTELASNLLETQSGLRQVRDSLRPRNRRQLTRVVAALAALVALIVLILVYRQMARERKILNAIAKLDKTDELVRFLNDASQSEQVRRKALCAIDALERFDGADLRLVEDAADRLLASFDQTERQLATEVGSLADSMSRRLQYRNATG